MKDDIPFRTQIENLFKLKRLAHPFARIVELELTSRCLNSCPYCGAFAGNGFSEIDFDVLQKYLEDVSSYLRKNWLHPAVSLCGGDPLLYTHFPPLVLLLKKLGMPFIIKGNPSTVEAGTLEFLAGNGCAGFKFTLFGNAETHDANRGNDTIAELEKKTRLVQSRNIPVIWNLTVGKVNLEATLDALPYVRSMQPDGVVVGRIARIGKLAEADDFKDITPSEYRDFLLQVLRFYHRYYMDGFNLLFKEKLWLPLLAEEGLLTLKPSTNGRIISGCEAYQNNLTVHHSGKLMMCGLMPSLPIGEFHRDSSYESTFVTGVRPLSLKETSPCHACKYTYYCRGCRAIALANTGGLYNKDPQCWVDEGK